MRPIRRSRRGQSAEGETVDPSIVFGLTERLPEPKSPPKATAEEPTAPDPSPVPLALASGETEELTLGFAVVPDTQGQARELSQPVVLATLLLALEAERSRISRMFSTQEEPGLQALAKLYWPLVVVPSSDPGRAALFDGTAVWTGTFQVPRLPWLPGAVEGSVPRWTAARPAIDSLHRVAEEFSGPAPVDVLTVPGFMASDPPLFLDLLAHMGLRGEPGADRAAFLPARHDVAWYRRAVALLDGGLSRLREDIRTLERLREGIQGATRELLLSLDQEYTMAELRADGRRATLEREFEDHIHESLSSANEQSRRELGHLLRARRRLARNRPQIEVARQLAARASSRNLDPSPHSDRAQAARTQSEGAERHIAEAYAELDRIHARLQERFQTLLEEVGRTEEEIAREMGERELERDAVLAASAHALETLEAQIALRAEHRRNLSRGFLPLPAFGAVRVAWFPFWLAVWDGPSGKIPRVFPPMRVRPNGGLAERFKGWFGGVVPPLEPRTDRFGGEMRRQLEYALVHDPWLARAASGLVRTADITQDPAFLDQLSYGLDELARTGWISQRRADQYWERWAVHHIARHPEAAGSRPPTRPETPFAGR